MAKRSIRESAAWKSLLDESDPPKVLACFEEIRKRLASKDVDVLLAVAADADAHERQRALAVLGRLAKDHDKRIAEPRRQVLVRELARAAEADYPRGLLGRTAMTYLHETEPSLAERIVTSQTDVQALSNAEREALVRDLRRYVSPTVEERLRHIMDLGGRAGTDAQQTLEGRGLLGLEAFEATAAEWRKTRSPDALNSLHGRWIANLVGKITIAKLVKLLGPPDERRGKSVWYMPNRDTALYLEGDAKGLLRAMKFT